MHAESGYLRLAAGGGLEAVVAQATGITEVSKGSIEGGDSAQRIALKSTQVANAQKVTEVAREYSLQPDGALKCVVSMAASGQPLQQHLSATLTRQ